MTKDLKADFWKRIDDVQAGMLSVEGGRAVPMSPMAERDENAIWFITARGTDAATAAETGSKVSLQVADPKANLYANVQGQLQAVNDPAKLDELWNAVVAAWFEDGRDDDKIRLVRMTPATAEVWATDGGAGFLYEIAKAHMTDEKPDMGDHGTVSF
ncbi:pyridoxamine 5'-phosphate oxidase family protein [Primorskyibacter sedentarius]|uniref:General stress protein 26 n=1 Tax=Primorskyibacter sedentarius TaxID=745311 RepID=A0A4R3J9Z9_9RHOB|nr:pyridoxamine 5'-phosphate oxidase family protein [Primorskyibacter sedentarius]TCS62344.1 general stress protein 26 [Primorskyibacter sedentarius]